MGQIVIGVVQQHYGWNLVFVVMSIMIFVSIVPLLRNLVREVKEIHAIYYIKL